MELPSNEALRAALVYAGTQTLNLELGKLLAASSATHRIIPTNSPRLLLMVYVLSLDCIQSRSFSLGAPFRLDELPSLDL